MRRDPQLGHVPLAALSHFALNEHGLGCVRFEAAPRRCPCRRLPPGRAARVGRASGPSTRGARGRPAGDPQDPPRRDRHAGEPLLRLLLRHVPRRRRDPDEGRRADRLQPRPEDARLRQAVPRHVRPQRRRPARHDRRGARHRSREDGRLPAASPDRALPRVSRHRQPRLLAHALGSRRNGLPRLARDPELLGLRAQLRPPGPHVRGGQLVEPPGPSLDGVRLGGALLEAPRPDELQAGLEGAVRSHGPRPEARLSVDGSDVPPAPPSRELALLRRERQPARLRGQPDVLPARTTGRVDSGHLEPAAALRHGAAGPPARQHPAARRTSTGPRARARSRRSRGSHRRRASASILLRS